MASRGANCRKSFRPVPLAGFGLLPRCSWTEWPCRKAELTAAVLSTTGTQDACLGSGRPTPELVSAPSPRVLTGSWPRAPGAVHHPTRADRVRLLSLTPNQASAPNSVPLRCPHQTPSSVSSSLLTVSLRRSESLSPVFPGPEPDPWPRLRRFAPLTTCLHTFRVFRVRPESHCPSRRRCLRKQGVYHYVLHA